MRVLHVHSGNLFGGVESTLLTLVREAGCAPDMETAFALAFDGRFSRELRALGGAPHMTGGVRLSRPHSVRSARAALRARLATGDIDVVVCQQPWSGVVFGSVAREMGYPYVLWVHMASDGRHWLERVAKWSPPDTVICNSRFTGARVEQWMPRVPRQVVYCPVAAPTGSGPQSRLALRRSYGVADTDVVIVMAARAEVWKGHQVLLEACARLADCPGWACWLAGSAQLPSEVAHLDSLRRTVAAHGLTGRVSFLGEREDMPAVLAASDVYCQPNLQAEAFGLSLVEAMYAGLPVVTTAAGGALEIADGTCGDLLEAGDVVGVANALRRLIDDRTRRERMGVAGQRRAGELCDPRHRMTDLAQVLSRWSRPALTVEGGAVPADLLTPFARLRIAMLSYRLPVSGEKRGGIERSAHTLAQGLAERGHHVVVFSHDDAPADASYEVRPLPWKGFADTWVGTRVTMGYLGNLLALVPGYRDFDVVVAHGDSLLLPLSGKPVLRVMHGSGWGEAQSARTWGRRFLQYGVYAQELLTAATQRGVVAVSENTRHDNRFVSHVIPHGVDSQVFHAVPGSKTAHPSVLFVGTLDGRKRGQFLVHAFLDVVRPAHPTATLTVVGPEGPEYPGVTYRTGVSDEALAELYQRAWVYASPSTYEGFGLPYLEAMACGTVVVATENPGSLEVLGNGEYGLMPDDAMFGAIVARVLADEPQRVSLAGRGLRRAAEFSLDAMVGRYESLLMELAVGHASPVTSR